MTFHAAIGRHGAGERLARHRHAQGYVAVVLDGGYLEAGESGRIRARAGMAVVHHAWSAHQDGFGATGAQVLNLPLPAGLAEGPVRITDPDAVARLAERDPLAAAELVRETAAALAAPPSDWPDLLAAALAADPSLPIRDWAHATSLDPASVSRGFARAYGVSPKRFRLELRTRRAVRALTGWRGTLAALAAEHGFADQAHFARAAGALTGLPPSRLRLLR
ncbi:helix-turn-helix domain-containing protein [Sphingomonas sp. BT-65]|uniref:helix-turn-helix domain-containing protein n=1 Tax=Sphingomonas sp. BT-65 TaxID=2989821 RepID=UPI002235DF25|nr:helix-turn-helix domain-containing protein [Sphingomonas sp. BT-65]MCW4462850.1 helix-turn-helix domain-containing protein [Sphingomonas sp. BT-65]